MRFPCLTGRYFRLPLNFGPPIFVRIVLLRFKKIHDEQTGAIQSKPPDRRRNTRLNALRKPASSRISSVVSGSSMSVTPSLRNLSKGMAVNPAALAADTMLSTPLHNSTTSKSLCSEALSRTEATVRPKISKVQARGFIAHNEGERKRTGDLEPLRLCLYLPLWSKEVGLLQHAKDVCDAVDLRKHAHYTSTDMNRQADLRAGSCTV